jgi:outer membrane protein assembly factor BamB
MKMLGKPCLLLGLCLVVPVAAQLQPGSPWPMYRHDARHTGRADVGMPVDTPAYWWVYTDTDLYDLAVGADGVVYAGGRGALWAINPDATVRWTLHLGAATVRAPVIDADGVIYVVSAYGLNAVSPDGVPLWWYLAEGEPTTPAIGADGTLYFGCTDYYFYAVWPNGELRWRFMADYAFLSAPTIGPDGTIYASDWDGKLYAFSPDGALKWTAFTTGARLLTPALSNDGRLFVGSYDGYLSAFGVDGRVLWSLPLGGVVWAPVIADDGTVYVYSYGEERLLSAVRSDGSMKWRTHVSGPPYYIPALGPDGTIYLDGHAIDPEDGRLLWYSDAVQSMPVVMADGTVVSPSHHYLLGWSERSCVVWRSDEEMGCLTSAVAAPDGTLYAGSDLGLLYALRPDGSVKWSLEAESEVKTPSVSPDGTIYIRTGDGLLGAVSPEGDLLWSLPGYPDARPVGFGADGTVYVAQGTSVTALHPDGTGKWQYTAEADVLCRPAVGPDRAAHFTTADGYLNAVAGNGNLRWRRYIGTATNSNPAVGTDGTIYIGTGTDGILAVEPWDGALSWAYGIGADVNEDPVVGPAGTVYIGHYGTVWAFDYSGTRLWRTDTPNWPGQSITVGQDGVVYSCGDDVLALSPSGEILAVSGYSGDWPGAAVLPGGKIVVQDDGRLVCLSMWTRKASGHLDLEHLVGPPPAVAPFELRAPGEVTTLGAQWAAIGPDGEFTAHTPPDLFDLSVKPSHWLRSTLRGVDATGGDVEGLFLAVTNGDVNGDNWVDLVDVALVLATLGTPGGQADLNHDGVVGVADLCIALSNFGSQGDP